MPWFLEDEESYVDQDWTEWDRVKINEFLFDQLKVDVDGDLGNDWDVQKSPGADGAPANNKGYDPIKPKLTWELRTPNHWSTYKKLLASVQPKPGKKAPVIITVVHPQLVLLKKEKFKIAKIHTLKKSGLQLMTAQFDLLEHFDKPKKIPKVEIFSSNPDTKMTETDGLIDYREKQSLPSKKVMPRDPADGGISKKFREG